ncbi:hypothetical protein TVAG_291240 [Trichomonas vaginalis G3]|uniref:Uncharacterized protein n=1 Tax=Trichomonas vaginalis (strain ATCC PRA-98 / G3) TaxID=412133 RepID=A2G0X5_TRIV3|nr:protein ubiquitination [Trichomonas vaginalis G3]EAX89199.1 hypothetical protein TVAG_291240 [Trichomonas vaginalis G3]KAI5500055.1 protein ubiquitination [Trichomonas vaginalis G3]|eukprot:XP_001302129.1 hypothetical protein [Trichomonas vaginalis G3]
MSHLEERFAEIRTHLKDYVSNNKLLMQFQKKDLESFFENTTFSSNDYITLLEQSSNTGYASTISELALKTNVEFNNYDEIISTLNTVNKCLKLKFFDSVINYINLSGTEINNLIARISYLETTIKKLLIEIDHPNKLRQSTSLNNENRSESSQNPDTDDDNLPVEFLMKLHELRKSRDFEIYYKFFDELSQNGNQNMITRACEEEFDQIYIRNYMHCPFG